VGNGAFCRYGVDPGHQHVAIIFLWKELNLHYQVPSINSYIQAHYVLVAEKFKERFYLRRDLAGKRSGAVTNSLTSGAGSTFGVALPPFLPVAVRFS
jgi:hypothetical protein